MTIKRFLTLLFILTAILALTLSACGPGDDDNAAGANGKANGKEKITICHKTGSVVKPYVEISIAENALKGHRKHEGDIIPAPEGGCPK